MSVWIARNVDSRSYACLDREWESHGALPPTILKAWPFLGGIPEVGFSCFGTRMNQGILQPNRAQIILMIPYIETQSPHCIGT